MEFWFGIEFICPKTNIIHSKIRCTDICRGYIQFALHSTHQNSLHYWKLKTVAFRTFFFGRFMSTHFRFGNNSNHLFSTDYNVLTAAFKRNHCSFWESWLWLYIVHPLQCGINITSSFIEKPNKRLFALSKNQKSSKFWAILKC